MKERSLIGVGVFWVVFALSCGAVAKADPLWGPRRCLVGWSHVYLSAHLVEVSGVQEGLLRVRKVASSRAPRGGVVGVNAQVVSLGAFFSADAEVLERKIRLRGINVLTIFLWGPAGSEVEVEIEAVVDGPPPPEVEFRAEPERIELGQSAVLSWSTRYARRVRIEPGVGDVALSGSVEVSPAETTTYVLTATGEGGTTSESAEVTVVIPPPTAELKAEPSQISLGQCSLLVWSSTYAESAWIEPGIGDVPPSGSLDVCPQQDTTYRLTVNGIGGTATAEVTVEVIQPQVGCDEGGGDFELWVDTPLDGDLISREEGPCIPVSGWIASGVGFENQEGAEVFVNGSPAQVSGDAFSGDVCLGFGENRILVEAQYMEEECFEECWEQDGETLCNDVCEWVEQYAWRELCVYLGHAVPVDLMITDPQDGATVRVPEISVEGIVFPHEASVAVGGQEVLVSPGGRFAGSVRLSAGPNTITATATYGGDTISDTIEVTYEVPPLPSIRITDPADGAVLHHTPITVSGTVDDEQAEATVNGISAVVSSGGFRAVDVPLDLGPNTITATATNPAGSASHTITVTLEEPSVPEVRITDPEQWAFVTESRISVSGYISDETSQVWVNGVRASVEGNSFRAEGVPLEPGVNRLEAAATNSVGTAFDSVKVVLEFQYQEQPEGSFGAYYEDLVPADSLVAHYAPGLFSVVTGLVLDEEGQPLSDVEVSTLGHKEYGTALTDPEGRFWLPVEGGCVLTVAFEREGLITVHRKIEVLPNEIALSDPVVMIPRDPVSTTVDFNGDPDTVVTHRSSLFADAWGSRSCTLVFTGDNRAWVLDERGRREEELSSITVRATEFPSAESMPARLPPESAFTYCVELEVEGRRRVHFERPVVVWIDNFLGFSVGDAVPLGYYDRDRGVWVPWDNGIVVRLLDTDSDGVVDALDADGDGLADDLDADGRFDDEVMGLEDQRYYAPDATFWRMEVPHFSPWDCNWPYVFPDDYVFPNPPGVTYVDHQMPSGRDCRRPAGSYVEERSGILHEDIPIAGTGVSLHYASNRTEGAGYGLSVPASGPAVPQSLKRIIVQVRMAGRSFYQELEPLPNQVAEFFWDGLDGLGRPFPGPLKADVRIGFVYDGVYASPASFRRAFGRFGGLATGIRSRQEVVAWRRDKVRVHPAHSVVKRGGGLIADGWTLSVHHALSPADPSTLHKGDGTKVQSVVPNVWVTDTKAGGGEVAGAAADGRPAVEARLESPMGVAVDARGNLYVTEYFGELARKVLPDGTIYTVGGCGISGYYGDGLPALEAAMGYPSDVEVDGQGNIYISQFPYDRIRMIHTSGIVLRIAGGDLGGFGGDGGPAAEALLNGPRGIAVDRHGNLYIADSYNHRIRKVDPSGIITTVAGDGISGFGGDGGPATEAHLNEPYDVAVDDQGNVYIADHYNYRIRMVDPSGIIRTVAGKGQMVGSDEDGIPAVEAQIGSPTSVAVDQAGNLYFTDGLRVRKVDSRGIISTVAGTGTAGYSGDGGPAIEAQFHTISDIAVGLKGELYLAEFRNKVVRKIAPLYNFSQRLGGDDLLFAEDPGVGYLVEASSGRHKETLDLDTGRTLFEFHYDEDGRLSAISDRFGNRMSLERDPSGAVTAIVSPHGVRTHLTVDQQNHLVGIRYPDGGEYGFEYSPEGYLLSKTDPEGNRFGHKYSPFGRVLEVSDEEGGLWTYTKYGQTDGQVATEVVSAEGDRTVYRDLESSTGAYSSTIMDPAGDVTTFETSADGLWVAKRLPCGMELTFGYGLDPLYGFQYVREVRERLPSGLERLALMEHMYEDRDGDDVADRVVRSITVNGKTVTLEDDLLQSVRILTRPSGRTVEEGYDPDTLLTLSRRVPGLYDAFFGYDTRGRLTSVTIGTRTTSFAYDDRGNLASITDPLGRSTSYEYDPVGRLVAVHKPDGGDVLFGYDLNGNLTVLTTPSSVDHGFTYDRRDLNTAYLSPLSGSYLYEYDRDRRLAAVLFPSGRKIQNVYSQGRLEEVRTPEGTVELTYGCSRRPVAMAKGGEGLEYGYDGPLLTSEIWSGTLNQALSYTYDDDLRVRAFTYAGRVEELFYDQDGLLVGSGAFQIVRDAQNGLPVQVAGGGFDLYRTFNGYGELSGETFWVGGKSVASWSVIRDDTGRIVSKTETVGQESTTYEYGYDPAGRLVSVVKDGVLVEEYGYGDNGARVSEMNLSKGVSGRGYSYSQEDHLLAAGGAIYSYDLDGYLTSKTVGAEVTTYEYSSRGELLRVTLPGGRLIEYVHDPLGRRIAKRVDGAVVEKYLWQGRTRLLAVYDGADNLLMRFVYADARMPVALEKSGAAYYLFYDQVGSLKLVADAEGNVVKRVDYDSFGRVVSDSNPAFRVPFGFAGGLYDPDTGLVRFGFRDYDPDVGRWTAKDPLLFAGGDTDLYGYCLNDPVGYIDPGGRVLQALLPALYFLAAKAGAMAVAYGGFKLAEQGVKLAASACPETRVKDKEMAEAIDRAFMVAGVVNAGEVLAFGGVNAAVQYQAISAALLSNPAAIQSSADFIQGALQPGPPPPTIPGYAGAGSRYLYDTLIIQSIRKYE